MNPSKAVVFNSPGLDGCFCPAWKLLGLLVRVVSQGVIRVWFIGLADSPVGLLPGFLLKAYFSISEKP